MTEYARQSAGPGVDIKGNPVVDPTRNVLDLVQAAIKRIDDLSVVLQRRQDDLRDQESRHVQEIAKLRSEFQGELRSAETERINAIRAVDVQAAQQGRLEGETRARALEAQVAAAAEAMRNQVASAATAAATALANALDPIQKDIADLRRAQYEQQGQKSQVQENRAGTSNAVAILGALVGLLVLGVLVASLYISTHHSPTPAVDIVTTTVTTPTTT